MSPSRLVPYNNYDINGKLSWKDNYLQKRNTQTNLQQKWQDIMRLATT